MESGNIVECMDRTIGNRLIEGYDPIGPTNQSSVERTFKIGNRVIGYLIKKKNPESSNTFLPNVDEFTAIEIARRLSPREKVHMKSDVLGVYKLLKHYGIDPDDFIDDEDIGIYVAERGYKTLSELSYGDHRARELVKERGLEKEIFQDFF
jgi:hypothetical protein